MRVNEAIALEKGIAELGLSLNKETTERLLAYLALLYKWNQVFNLTAIRDKDEMVSYHLLDSLAVLPYIWEGKWLDVGSGGGLPGLVLAIVKPEWHFTLLDSNTKKTSFLQQAVIELNLKNVRVYAGRVEDMQEEGRFEGIISRAFTELSEFFAITRHLLASTGHWVAMKGVVDQELDAVRRDVAIEKIVELKVPGLNAKRSLVIAKISGE